MNYYNFMLGDAKFMNVKSVLGLLSMGIQCGDRLRFIATGAQAQQALAAVARAVGRTDEEDAGGRGRNAPDSGGEADARRPT